MYHSLPSDARFWPFLTAIDEDLAETARQKSCPWCGGRLHCANYPRKPRGAPGSLSEQDRLRLSFCCERNGCRKRTTPLSVRFLGRKVYLAVVVILVAAMRHGPTPRRIRALSAHFGVDRRTIARWQVFWRELVPNTPFWKAERARLAPALDTTTLPLSLLDAFLHGPEDYGGWERLLRFLAPITVPTGLRIALS